MDSYQFLIIRSPAALAASTPYSHKVSVPLCNSYFANSAAKKDEIMKRTEGQALQKNDVPCFTMVLPMSVRATSCPQKHLLTPSVLMCPLSMITDPANEQ
jgi:hypothetical protein